MPVKLRNTSGKNFGASELSGPNRNQKKVRANLLSAAPNLFTGNRSAPMATNDVAKSFGVDAMIKSTPIRKAKKSK